jgi:hypothetical protein
MVRLTDRPQTWHTWNVMRFELLPADPTIDWYAHYHAETSCQPLS